MKFGSEPSPRTIRRTVLKPLIHVTAALIVLSAAGSGVIFTNFGGAAGKALSAALSISMDHPVSIDGPVSFRLSSPPQVTFDDLRIEIDRSVEDHGVIKVEQGRIEFSIDGILDGRLVIPAAYFGGVELALANWPLDAPANQDDGNMIDGPGTGTHAIFGEVTIERARLSVGAPGSTERLELQLDRFTLLGDLESPATVIKAQGRIQDQPFSLDGGFVQPMHVVMGRGSIPVNLQLASGLIDATLAGDVTPSNGRAALDVLFEVVAYDIGELARFFGPDFAVGGLARISGRLKGDLGTPAATNVEAQILLENGTNIDLAGSIEDVGSMDGIEFTAGAEIAPDACLPPDGPAWLPTPRRCGFDARIEGGMDRLAIRKFVGRIEGSDKSLATIQADALLTRSRDGPKIDNASGEFSVALANPRLAFGPMAGDVPDLGRIEARGGFSVGPNGAVILSNGSVSSSERPGFKNRFSGTIGRLEMTQGRVALDLDLDLEIQGSVPRLARMVPALGSKMPFLGKFDYALRLAGGAERLRASSINVSGLTDDHATLEVTGQIGVINTGDETPRFRELDLQLVSASPSTAWLSNWLGVKAPELGEVNAKAAVIGASDDIRVEGIDIVTKNPAASRAQLTGSVGHLAFTSGNVAAADIDLLLEGEVHSNTALARLIDADVPLARGLEFNARLIGNSDALAAQQVALHGNGEHGLTFQMTGGVRDILDQKGVDLAVAAGFDPSPIFGGNTGGSLGRVAGTGQLTDQDGSLGLEAIEIKVTGSDLWRAAASGQIDDIMESNEVELYARFHIMDPPAFAAALGKQSPIPGAMTFEGTIGGSADELLAAGELLIGSTRFNGEVSGTLNTARPRFKGVLVSDRVDVADFGVQDPRDREDSAVSPPPKKPETEPVFGDDRIPFEMLRHADIDLDVEFEAIRSPRFAVDRLSGSLHLENGVLDLDPLTFRFVGGDLLTSLHIAADNSPPRIRLAASARDLDLGETFQTIGRQVPIDGTFDLDLVLAARGSTPKQLSRTVDGPMVAVLSEGWISGGFFDLLGLDVFTRLLPPAVLQGTTDIHCWVMRSSGASGVITLDKFVLDTPGNRVNASGSIDLGAEKMKLVFVPIAKRRLMGRLSEPLSVTVGVRGALASPDISVNPVGLAADLAARVAYSPVKALEGIFSRVIGDNSEHDHPCRAT
jgi:hypothetical protein